MAKLRKRHASRLHPGIGLSRTILDRQLLQPLTGPDAATWATGDGSRNPVKRGPCTLPVPIDRAFHHWPALAPLIMTSSQTLVPFSAAYHVGTPWPATYTSNATCGN